MNKLRRTGAIVTLSLTLAVSTFAGTIYSPGAKPPPIDPTAQSTSTTSISTTTMTTLILTIISLIG
ncbi:MAG TPA: hypothetical protein VKB05_12120 [Pyrinomonadaceae bacterium]|nr:hypothetical protein [Pyrinomonadaceae bacterium]